MSAEVRRPGEVVLVMNWLYVTMPNGAAAQFQLEPTTRHAALDRTQLRRLAAILRDLADAAT